MLYWKILLATDSKISLKGDILLDYIVFEVAMCLGIFLKCWIS